MLRVGDGRLAGERLAPGTPIRLVDDLAYSGETLCAAVDALRRVDLPLHVRFRNPLDPPSGGIGSRVGGMRLQQVTCLVSQADMPE